MATPGTASIYVWQMNDGSWQVSARGGRATAAVTADNMLLWEEGFGGGFDTRKELEAALRAKGFRF